MKDDTIYSADDITRTYKEVPDHVETRRFISRYSINHDDIRDVALRGLDLSSVDAVLELGCAYGFFTEKLVEYVKPGTDVTGVDLVDEGNRVSFLRVIRNGGCFGRFIAGNADCIKTMARDSFDLIIASYSLYFFPHLIGEIARVLKTGGIFITVTHAEESLKEIIDFMPAVDYTGITGGQDRSEPAISRLFKVFSMENGERQLKDYFGGIEKIIYPNKLVFPRERIEDCFDYLSKKRNLLFKEVIDTEPRRLEEVMAGFFDRIREFILGKTVMEITKNDCVFRCHNPQR